MSSNHQRLTAVCLVETVPMTKSTEWISNGQTRTRNRESELQHCICTSIIDQRETFSRTVYTCILELGIIAASACIHMVQCHPQKTMTPQLNVETNWDTSCSIRTQDSTAQIRRLTLAVYATKANCRLSDKCPKAYRSPWRTKVRRSFD